MKEKAGGLYIYLVIVLISPFTVRLYYTLLLNASLYTLHTLYLYLIRFTLMLPFLYFFHNFGLVFLLFFDNDSKGSCDYTQRWGTIVLSLILFQ